ncbi:MAG: sigma-54 interaction domain-containing protein [Thermodesulfobacteriota bacterium]
MAESDSGLLYRLDLTDVDVMSVLSELDEGIIIADRKGRIIYYNQKQAQIDDIAPEYALGKTITELYHLTDENSMILKCMRRGEPIKGQLFFYQTRLGKVANTIHSVFPLTRKGQVIGAICFVKDYNLLEKTVTASSVLTPHKRRRLGNGTRYDFTDVIGGDPDFLHVLKMARLAADSPSPIMLCGETGTGKEIFAQSIHNYSARHSKRFIGINCAAIPENLLEGLLFGTAKGAFTGASDKPGIFEQASAGTLFLDEVDSMPVGLQAKLLRALQEKKVRRVGSSEEIDIDLKIISSVNTEPHRAIKEGILRMDLFYRLGVVYIRIPPLRDRRTDIDLLTRHFIYKNNLALNTAVQSLSESVKTLFNEYRWPGNVRELEHVIEGAMNLIGQEDTLQPDHLPEHMILNTPGTDAGRPRSGTRAVLSGPSDQRPPEPRSESRPSATGPPPVRNLAETQMAREKRIIEEALRKARGNISRAARSIGISRQLCHYKMKKYRIDRTVYVD